MNQRATIAYIRPKTTLIGQETPGLTYLLFKRCAIRAEAKRKRAARRLYWKITLKHIFTFGKYPAWRKREAVITRPTNEPIPQY